MPSLLLLSFFIQFILITPGFKTPANLIKSSLMYLKKKNIKITVVMLDSAPGKYVNLLWIISNPHAATSPPVLIKSQPYKIMKIPGTAFILLLTAIYFSSTKNV